ncbi:hypothetical protein PF008_g3369 [Phytophthora fragariae]|uniref:RxLR effector protein n=1 Tax=Phytophthora fragariae TaxID=53985 RepID=A0A6G0SEM3_9STRA|nr:hypothetical protein PF008_g3369 [Phytophthora fragariae]
MRKCTTLCFLLLSITASTICPTLPSCSITSWGRERRKGSSYGLSDPVLKTGCSLRPGGKFNS